MNYSNKMLQLHGYVHGSATKNETRFNQMIVAIVDVLTSYDIISND